MVAGEKAPTQLGAPGTRAGGKVATAASDATTTGANDGGAGTAARMAKGVVAALTYSSCSISMVLMNKAVLSSYEYHNHMTLLLYQTGLAFVMLLIAGKLGYAEVPPFDWRLAKVWFPVNLFFLAMLFSSYLSLQHLNVALVTIFKNVTNVGVALGDFYMFGRRASNGVMLSLAVMVAGAVLTGFSDVSFNLVGYVWMAINCASTAGYLLYMRYVMQTRTRMTKSQMAYYNSMLGIPIVFAAAVVMGELPSGLYAPQMSSFGFVFAATASGVVGFMLQFASLWCLSATSPTTYAMVGSFNKVPTAVLGVLLFNTPLTPKLATFVGVGIVGGLMFSHAKSREAAAAAEAQKLKNKVATVAADDADVEMGKRDSQTLLRHKEASRHQA